MLFFTLQILTKDSVTVSVDGVVYFRIKCPISSVANVSNVHSSTRLLAQTTLRNVLGTKNLAELLSDREGISLNMQVSINCVVVQFNHEELQHTRKVGLLNILNWFFFQSAIFNSACCWILSVSQNIAWNCFPPLQKCLWSRWARELLYHNDPGIIIYKG